MGILRRNKKPAAGGGKPSDDQPVLPPIDFKPSAFPKDEAQGVVIAVRQLPGYPTAAGMIAQALSVRADRILLDFAAQGVAVRFRVDGAWENMPPLDRANGDGALFAIKKLFGMNPNDRRARQTGKCNLQFSGVDWIVEALSQGVPSGERAMLSFEFKKPVLKSLADLGMRDKMAEELRGFLNGHGGMVIVSGPAGQGLPTTWKIVLESADKFVRDFISIEDCKELDPDIINVSKVTFDTSAGETPEGVLTRRILKQPDAFVMPSLYNANVVEILCKQVLGENRHLITRVVANDAIDALLQVASTYRKSAKELVKMTHAVLNQRLVRRLCESCKQGFQPSPQLLQKLGIPQGRVAKLYQPFVPPPPDQRVDAKGNPIEIEICRRCGGRGYFGRIAIFELLVVTDELRKAVLTNPMPSICERLQHKWGIVVSRKRVS